MTKQKTLQVMALFDGESTETAECPFCGSVVAAEYARPGQGGYLNHYANVGEYCPHFEMFCDGGGDYTITSFVIAKFKGDTND